MNLPTQLPNWKKETSQIQATGYMIAGLTSLFTALIFAATQQILIILIGVNLLILYATIHYSRRSHTMEKIYRINIIEANKIVTAVLDSKQLPYDTQSQNQTIRHLITPKELTLSLTPYNPYQQDNWFPEKDTFANSPDSKITLTFHTRDNQLLATSLQQKLDDALTPATVSSKM